MDRGRVVKKIFERKQEGRRGMGRPRLRWKLFRMINEKERLKDSDSRWWTKNGHLY
jgi:hypothetical protein